MRINHNINALNSWRNITMVNMDMSKTLERLSSGLRINRAGDDAAGLAISEKMRGQIRGLEMAVKNAQDAISLIQTAEGALTEVHAILQRMRELAVQAATDTNTNVDRDQIQAELNQLREEIDRIARTTEFNTKKLLDGKLEGFRFKADVKVVTGGNIDLKAQEVTYKVRNETLHTLLGPGIVSAQINTYNLSGSIQNVRLDVGDTEFDWVYQEMNVSGIPGGLRLVVGFRSVGDNSVQVVVRHGSINGTLLGSGTLGGDGTIVLANNIYSGTTIILPGALYIDFADNGLNTVISAQLRNAQARTNSLGYRTQAALVTLGQLGFGSLPIINLGGGNATVEYRFTIHGIGITLSFESISDTSIQVTAIRGGQILAQGVFGDTATNARLDFVRDIVAGNTIIDLSHVTLSFGGQGERVTSVTIRATGYFNNLTTFQNVTQIPLRTVQFNVLDEKNNIAVNGSAMTFHTLNVGGDAKIVVGFQSVGANQIRYVARSYSGLTLAAGTIQASSLNAYGFFSVNLGDDLVLNVSFGRYNSSLNTASIFLTSRSYAAQEGSYVVEVGQFLGSVSSPLDFRVVKSGATGVEVTSAGNLRRGFSVTQGIVFTWRPEEHTISEFGEALPNEEIIDSAVARIEGQYTKDTQLIFQIGSNEGHNMFVGIDDMSAAALGITTSSLKVTDQNSAERAIMVVDAAIHKVSSARAALGAVQNRLEHTIANLGVAAENLTAAESRIRDADMAKEMMQFTKQQILLQSSMAMLAQANAQPQNVLQLLR